MGGLNGERDLDLLHDCHGCADTVWLNNGNSPDATLYQLLS